MSASRSTPTNSSSPTVKPFDTGALVSNPLLRALYRPLQGLVEQRLGFPQLNHIYAASSGDDAEVGPFWRKALAQLQTSWSLSDTDQAELAGIQGPLVIVANHPLAGSIHFA